MRNWSLFILVFLVSLGFPGPALADSPITSTGFHQHYAQAGVVAARSGRMSTPVLNFLLGRAPTDQKAACVNALSWQKDPTGNAQAFVKALEGKYRKQGKALSTGDLAADELMTLGYLLAMHDYFKFEPLEKARGGLWAAQPKALLAEAVLRSPADFTIAMIAALIAVQNTPDKDWCQVYSLVQAVLDRFPAADRNLKPEAVKSIMEYIGAYKKYCPLPAGQLDLGFLDAQEMIPYAGQLAVATLAGVALWDSKTHKLLSVHKRGITVSLAVLGGKLWAGSNSTLARWDGRAWKEYLKWDGTQKTGFYRLATDPKGVLHVFWNRSHWQYDATGDRFVALPTEGFNFFHGAFSTTGELWGISLLKGIRRKSGTAWFSYATKSAGYPGRDPRRVIVDARKHIWIADFANGFFRFDPVKDQFVQDGPKLDKAVDLRVDVARGRTWYLHYTKGVTLVENGKLQAFDLSREILHGQVIHHKYLRCLHLADNGDLYVGTENALVRIYREKGTYRIRSYTQTKLP
ncbi:hypothetical protein KJ612_00015 [Myxococcota bacterium]|nr:hypothetical protein [Myxococcota bacterium]MBU1410422.1 hypothetical protein [Myxococcota bacterium]